MKRVLMLIMAMAMVSGVARAQFPSSNEVYAYIRAGNAIGPKTSIFLFMFKDGYSYFYTSNYQLVVEHYKKDPTLISYFITSDGRMRSEVGSPYRYDSKSSTNEITTYHLYSSSMFATLDYYHAFSKDRQLCIIWDGHTPNDRSYYQRIQLSDFAPKSLNHDFLYE